MEKYFDRAAKFNRWKMGSFLDRWPPYIFLHRTAIKNGWHLNRFFDWSVCIVVFRLKCISALRKFSRIVRGWLFLFVSLFAHDFYVEHVNRRARWYLCWLEWGRSFLDGQVLQDIQLRQVSDAFRWEVIRAKDICKAFYMFFVFLWPLLFLLLFLFLILRNATAAWGVRSRALFLMNYIRLSFVVNFFFLYQLMSVALSSYTVLMLDRLQ